MAHSRGDDPFGSSKEEQIQKQIFISTFSMLAKLADADGTVTKREVDLIEKVIDEVLKLDPARKRYAIRVFNEARRSPTDFRTYAEQYKKLLRNKPEMFEWMMDILLRVALVDTLYSGAEADTLQVACEVFEIPRERYEELRSRYGGGPMNINPADYRLLGCTPGCSDQDIEARYQKLSQDYDPARIIAYNLPHDFVELAEKRSEEIREAYIRIIRERGTQR